MNTKNFTPYPESLFSDICSLIDTSKQRVAVSVNSEIILMNWNIGKRIKEDILHNKRAEYGKEIVKNISIKLTQKYGSGWGHKHLQHCLRSAEIFSEEEILYAVRSQLSWTHIRTFSYIDDTLKRLFYMEMCILEHWSTRVLNDKYRYTTLRKNSH